MALIAPGVVAQTAVETPRTIRVVVDNAYAPFAFQADDGTLEGILIDQWRAWEQKTGIKVEIHAMDWAEALRRMRAGEFDVIDCIVATAQRRDYFDFTPAYAPVEASIFFRNDISGITGLASLRGFPVGVKAGDQHIDTLEANGVTTVIPFQSNDALIEAAKERKINVFLADDPSALYLLHKGGIEADFRHSAPIFRDQLRRAVRKGDAALLRTVSEGFAAIDPGELTRIDEKWFGRTISRIRRYIAYAGYGAAVAILVIAGLAAWNRTLRKAILQRTAALSESEQRFAAAFRSTPNISTIATLADGRFLDVNAAFVQMFEYERDEAIGQTALGLGLYADPRRRPALMGLLDKGAVRNIEVQGRTKSGRIRDLLVSMERIEIGGEACVLSSASDISDQKIAERRLDASVSQLRALANRLLHAQDEERRRIAQMLHETTAQDLAGLKMILGQLNRTADHLSDSQRGALSESMSLAEQAMTQIRTLSYLLHPPFLDEAGLLSALRWYAAGFAERSGIKVDLELPEHLERLPLDTETALFRVVQESLTNIHRHADSGTARIRLQHDVEALVLEIEDRGHGIPKASLKRITSRGGVSGVGVAGMSERIEQLGGSLDLTSSEQGTSVRVSLPLERLATRPQNRLWR